MSTEVIEEERERVNPKIPFIILLIFVFLTAIYIVATLIKALLLYTRSLSFLD